METALPHAPASLDDLPLNFVKAELLPWLPAADRARLLGTCVRLRSLSLELDGSSPYALGLSGDIGATWRTVNAAESLGARDAVVLEALIGAVLAAARPLAKNLRKLVREPTHGFFVTVLLNAAFGSPAAMLLADQLTYWPEDPGLVAQTKHIDPMPRQGRGFYVPVLSRRGETLYAQSQPFNDPATQLFAHLAHKVTQYPELLPALRRYAATVPFLIVSIVVVKEVRDQYQAAINSRAPVASQIPLVDLFPAIWRAVEQNLARDLHNELKSIKATVVTCGDQPTPWVQTTKAYAERPDLDWRDAKITFHL